MVFQAAFGAALRRGQIGSLKNEYSPIAWIFIYLTTVKPRSTEFQAAFELRCGVAQ